ncbi:unnamed protein product [Bursaphelenchus xylophilus]|uniref:Cell division cycle protein 27 homolog n=1 Tax=Bursaphelenchus xylophilus TaxID=6326 RepID=A0A1I7S127_BURXY|nr:unnamed protein product [Bursaphelenchus xylophilus]CAG9079882.1 unnamed protein product [Bursaphelenchus xylophilus]
MCVIQSHASASKMLAAIEQRKDCVDIILPLSVENVIQQCLNHFDYENAAILAEVLYAKERSDSTLLLYAQCLMRWGKVKATYELLKSEGYERCGMTRFIFAKCAFTLRKLEEAESALRRENSSYLNIQIHESFDESSQPFAHKLLAQVYTEIGRLEQAQAHYTLSLVGNPILFDTMKQFGQLGGDSVTKLFGALTDENEARPVKALRRYAERIARARTRILDLPRTPTKETAQPISPVHIRPTASQPGAINTVKKRRTPTSLSQPTRQSISPPRMTNKKAPNVDRAVVEFMLQLSEAVHALSFYRCEEAVQILNQTSMAFKQLSITLRLRGIVLFELRDYARCSEVLLELRRIFPSRIEGMETLSTALWQLQNQHQLSALAADLVNTNRDHAITWCVVGNSLSLQKHHEAAVEAFERAIQMDSRFGYAYSLLGHELIDLNKLNRALEAFKQAQIHSPNDYRALYGEGLVHFKNEKLEFSLAVFKKAVKINPRNVILLCQLAIVEHSLKRNAEAMEHLRRALEIDPNSIASRYHKARILFDQAQYKEAEKELNELKNLSPDEAHVFFLLGRVHRRLGDQHRAMLNFSWATEIDPRGEQNQSTVSDGPYDDDAVDQNDTDRA